MKTDREIAEEAENWYFEDTPAKVVDACERAISLARQYGALAPAAPQPIDWDRVRIDAAISALQGLVSFNGEQSYSSAADDACEYGHALCMTLKIKMGLMEKGGAA